MASAAHRLKCLDLSLVDLPAGAVGGRNASFWRTGYPKLESRGGLEEKHRTALHLDHRQRASAIRAAIELGWTLNECSDKNWNMQETEQVGLGFPRRESGYDVILPPDPSSAVFKQIQRNSGRLHQYTGIRKWTGVMGVHYCVTFIDVGTSRATVGWLLGGPEANSSGSSVSQPSEPSNLVPGTTTIENSKIYCMASVVQCPILRFHLYKLEGCFFFSFMS